MSILFGKKEKDALRKDIRKDADKKAKQNMTVAEFYATLGDCKRVFEKTIVVERLNALTRREKRIGDAAQKKKIHDAAVGLIAIEELEIDLQSADITRDMTAAQKKLGYVVRQIGRIDPNEEITKKELKEQTSYTFDDTNETEAFAERADMVDEQFVEYLIQGLSMEECLEKKVSGVPAAGYTVAPSVGQMNFSSGDEEKDAEYIDSVLRKNADKR